MLSSSTQEPRGPVRVEQAPCPRASAEPLPDIIPVWSSTLRVMSGFLDLLTRMQTKSDRLVAVEAARCLRQLSDDLQALGVEPPELPAMTRDVLSDWVLYTSARLVRAGSHAAER